MIQGKILKAYLEKRRSKKQPCQPDQLYCVKCETPKIPAGRMADFIPINDTTGNLRGICPDCNRLMHRWASISKITADAPNLDISFQLDQRRIEISPNPPLNRDSERAS